MSLSGGGDLKSMEDDNDNDYLEILKELYSGPGDKDKHAAEMEVNDNPEYVFSQDVADKETKDQEELRYDKATKITKKEHADLMAEDDNDNDYLEILKELYSGPGDKDKHADEMEVNDDPEYVFSQDADKETKDHEEL